MYGPQAGFKRPFVCTSMIFTRDAKNDGKGADNRDSNAAERGNENAVFRRLRSAVRLAATTRPQPGGGGPNAAFSRTPVSAAERHNPYRKKSRSSVSGRGIAGVGYDSSGDAVTSRPGDRYVDPVLVQETSRGVDYLTAYPLGKVCDDDKTCYDDVDQPAEVWKTNVIGEAKSSKNNNNNRSVDDDEEEEVDDEFTT
ncbi:Hypothetical protein CINCED_3A010866 [Cinara cedri]|uniref:Uncharacterized protein n=1 Tax=Cinara cedri TaxID=506608 RepID=A0A5E4N4E2_9HEMI|nr:Hypothetical protein CINCED_3A010866 [Cinara cedri]